MDDPETKDGQLKTKPRLNSPEKAHTDYSNSSRARKAREAATPLPQNDLGHIIAIPKKKPAYSSHRPSPMHLLANQRCLICNAYSCQPVYITPLDQGGEAQGDNLLPVCDLHAVIPLLDLYENYPQVCTWLNEHERIDTILIYERALIRLKRKRQW